MGVPADLKLFERSQWTFVICVLAGLCDLSVSRDGSNLVTLLTMKTQLRAQFR